MPKMTVTAVGMDVCSFYSQSPGESMPRLRLLLIQWALHHYFIETFVRLEFIVRETQSIHYAISKHLYGTAILLSRHNFPSKYAYFPFSHSRAAQCTSLTRESIVCTPLIFSSVTSRYLLANGNTSSKSRLPQAGKSVEFLCSICR